MSQMTNFVEVTEEFHQKTGGERHFRKISDDLWVSVLYRLTGYGTMVWETAVVRVRKDGDPLKYARGKWDDREMFLFIGDYRSELETVDEEGVMGWVKNMLEGGHTGL